MQQPEPLVSAKDLEVGFKLPAKAMFQAPRLLKAIRGVSFDLPKGKTLAVVGESGSGKSTLARAVLGLVPITGGQVLFDGNDLAPTFRKGGQATRGFRRHAQMIFQDPIASLSPRLTVQQILEEPLRVHGLPLGTKVRDMMDKVGLARGMAKRFPHEFSGGQAQRIGIARALMVEPKLVVADEPVSALDVSIQAQVLNLLAELKEELGLTLLFISHDLSVVRHIADEVLVMYLGSVVEHGASENIFAGPKHPYTQALLSAVPSHDPKLAKQSKRIALAGEPPSPINPPSGCVFRTRCSYATEICGGEVPGLEDFANRKVACTRKAELT